MSSHAFTTVCGMVRAVLSAILRHAHDGMVTALVTIPGAHFASAVSPATDWHFSIPHKADTFAMAAPKLRCKLTSTVHGAGTGRSDTMVRMPAFTVLVVALLPTASR